MKREKHRCKRCGRRLTNPIYKRIGYGKVCYEKVKVVEERQNELPINPSNHADLKEILK